MQASIKSQVTVVRIKQVESLLLLKQVTSQVIQTSDDLSRYPHLISFHFIFHLKGGANSIFLKNRILIYTNESCSVITYGPLDMCGGHCVCSALPSACSIMFLVSWDVSGQRVGAFPPVTDSVQVRLGVNKT